MSTLLNDEYFMTLAIDEAKKAAVADEVPIGAIIVLNDKVIGAASNQVERLTDVTAHAEILAITSAQMYLGSKFLDECTMYVTIEPCVMCAGALRWARIGRLVFGAFEPKFGYTRFSRDILHPSTVYEGGVLEEKCSELMKKFFLSKR